MTKKTITAGDQVSYDKTTYKVFKVYKDVYTRLLTALVYREGKDTYTSISLCHLQRVPTVKYQVVYSRMALSGPTCKRRLNLPSEMVKPIQCLIEEDAEQWHNHVYNTTVLRYRLMDGEIDSVDVMGKVLPSGGKVEWYD